METFKFGLSRKGKSICPMCKRKTFVLYVNNATGEPLHSSVGRCDRLDNCAFHYSPRQYFTDNHIPFDSKNEHASTPQPTLKPQPSFIDTELMKKTLTGYENNRLIQYLKSVVGNEATRQAIDMYRIGTSKIGGTVFWQIDIQGRIRTGKIIVYGTNGHRRKDITPAVNWAHKILKFPNFNLEQCLFGEHLLVDKSKSVAIVESEKTALVSSIYLPDMLWLACGGGEGLSTKKFAVLKGRTVRLFPDAGMFDKWSIKAKELSKICSITVSSLIENNATDEERSAGYDLCDYLIKFPLSEFAEPQQGEQETKIKPEAENENKKVAYVSDEGILFIPTPPCNRVTYTVYPSVEAYNKRLIVPKIISMKDVDVSNMRLTFIDLKTLKI